MNTKQKIESQINLLSLIAERSDLEMKLGIRQRPEISAAELEDSRKHAEAIYKALENKDPRTFFSTTQMDESDFPETLLDTPFATMSSASKVSEDILKLRTKLTASV